MRCAWGESFRAQTVGLRAPSLLNWWVDDDKRGDGCRRTERWEMGGTVPGPSTSPRPAKSPIKKKRRDRRIGSRRVVNFFSGRRFHCPCRARGRPARRSRRGKGEGGGGAAGEAAGQGRGGDSAIPARLGRRGGGGGRGTLRDRADRDRGAAGGRPRGPGSGPRAGQDEGGAGEDLGRVAPPGPGDPPPLGPEGGVALHRALVLAVLLGGHPQAAPRSVTAGAGSRAGPAPGSPPPASG